VGQRRRSRVIGDPLGAAAAIDTMRQVPPSRHRIKRVKVHLFRDEFESLAAGSPAFAAREKYAAALKKRAIALAAAKGRASAASPGSTTVPSSKTLAPLAGAIQRDGRVLLPIREQDLRPGTSGASMPVLGLGSGRRPPASAIDAHGSRRPRRCTLLGAPFQVLGLMEFAALLDRQAFLRYLGPSAHKILHETGAKFKVPDLKPRPGLGVQPSLFDFHVEARIAAQKAARALAGSESHDDGRGGLGVAADSGAGVGDDNQFVQSAVVLGGGALQARAVRRVEE